jgi:thiamine-phosphate diphosphorylase
MSGPSSCTICLVTDRRRLGAGDRSSLDQLLQLIRHAAGAGVDLVQIRERDLEGRALTRLVDGALESVQGSRTKILVNDRLDIAIAAGAHGTHLRGDSFSSSDARQIAPPGHLMGRSVHSAAEAIAAERGGGLDYLILGTVFPTQSKPDGHTTIGVGGLSRVVASVLLPVLAVGGVSMASLPKIARAGIAGFAAIEFFVKAWRSGGESALARSIDDARLAFDRSQPHP